MGDAVGRKLNLRRRIAAGRILPTAAGGFDVSIFIDHISDVMFKSAVSGVNLEKSYRLFSLISPVFFFHPTPTQLSVGRPVGC